LAAVRVAGIRVPAPRRALVDGSKTRRIVGAPPIRFPSPQAIHGEQRRTLCLWIERGITM